MKAELFVDTGVLAEYLLHEGPRPALLERLATAAMLFTSVLNATELLAAVQTDEDRYSVESVLGGVHVLGFHQRYARSFGALAAGRTDAWHLRNCMVAGCCIEADLPLVTHDTKLYKGFRHLTVIEAGRLRCAERWQDIEVLLRVEQHDGTVNCP